jgi:Gas vesicle synthesis protein GvpL/GvpF
MADTAVYVYCVVKSATRPSFRRVPPGLPHAGAAAPVALGGGLWLIVADVPLDVYGPGRLDQALRDMQWVGEVAMAHEAVVEHFARLKKATAVPAKLFTMFSTVERALADTRSRRREITEAARRIADCEEWGVRIVRAATEAPRPPVTPRATSGAGFLEAKKRARDEKIASARAAAEAAAAAFDSLSMFARDARRRDNVPDTATTPPLLDAAFLVPLARKTRFKSAARRAAEGCARSGASMTLTGPWPAYNFIEPPEAGR